MNVRVVYLLETPGPCRRSVVLAHGHGTAGALNLDWTRMREPLFSSFQADKGWGTTLGFIAQPFVTAALGFCLFPFYALTSGVQRISLDLLEGALGFGIVTGFVGLILTAFFAAPVFFWLRARGPVTWRQAVISGALIGNVPGVLIMGVLFLQGKAADPTALGLAFAAVRTILFGSCIGAAAAAAFWRIAGCEDEDSSPLDDQARCEPPNILGL